MSVLLPNPKELEKKQDQEIAAEFVKSLEQELAKTQNIEAVISDLKIELKDLIKKHPYLVGIVIGILMTKYFDISKEIQK